MRQKDMRDTRDKRINLPVTLDSERDLSRMLMGFSISEESWLDLVKSKGNLQKAMAWANARLQEVETLSTETQKAYLRVMITLYGSSPKSVGMAEAD